VVAVADHRVAAEVVDEGHDINLLVVDDVTIKVCACVVTLRHAMDARVHRTFLTQSMFAIFYFFWAVHRVLVTWLVQLLLRLQQDQQATLGSNVRKQSSC